MASAPVADETEDREYFPLAKQPVRYNDDLFREILVRIADGETYAAIRRSDPARFPHPSTLGDWINASTARDLAHARAREIQADTIAEDCLRIADDATGDAYVAYTADGKPYVKIDTDFIKRAQVRIDTRLKIIAKWQPRRYGEKLLHAGHDGKEIKIDQRLDIRAIADQLRAVTRKPEPPVIEHDDGGDLV